MNVAMFLILLSLFATVTGLFVEAAKKLLEESKLSYAPNLLACIVGCIVGIGGTAIYYILSGTVFSPTNTVCMILMGMAVSLGSMLGYDKITQTIAQFTAH